MRTCVVSGTVNMLQRERQPSTRTFNWIAALQSRSSHLPGCGAGLALAALPLALAAASSAGTSLEANLKHITVTLATWDAVWEVYLDPKWARQRLRLYGAQDRALEQFFNKLEKEMAELSMKRHNRAKQLVVFFGAASIGTRGGWGADAVLRACRKVVCRPRGKDQDGGRVVLVDEHRTSRVSSAVNGKQPCEVELNTLSATRLAGWKPTAGQVEERLVRPAWSQERGQPVRGLVWCPVVAPRRPPQAPRSGQAATQPAASEPGPSTPQPAKRSKRTKAEPGVAEPTKGKGKAAKAKPAPQPGRWLDRDCNAALNMQRIGESRWRPLELCYWPDQGALPAKGKEYPGLGYKRLRDKPPKAQEQQQQPAEAQGTWRVRGSKLMLILKPTTCAPYLVQCRCNAVCCNVVILTRHTHRIGRGCVSAETLTAQLLFHKPDNPRSFLIKYLEKVKVEGAQPLIDETDLRTTFAMLDVLKRGSVTEDQALSTLRSMLGAGASLSDHPGAVPHGKFLKEVWLHVSLFLSWLQQNLKALLAISHSSYCFQVDEHRTSRVSSAVNGKQPCEVELNTLSATRLAGWKPTAGQVEERLVRPAWSQERGQPVRGLVWCPVVAPRRPPQAPRSGQAATQPAASEPGPSTPQPAKRSKRTKAEPGVAEPTKGKGKAAKAKPAPQPGRWLDRDCNAALNMQRIGESRWRPLELCYWPDQGALPAKGKEYPGLGYKRLRDKPPKAQEQQQQPAEAQ
ncbi:hypothetical protein QJQ45_016182 [Haematococcus lacustris]|nr:hypothetical protein QJQ45_016182 [Haematococcus lacustris]